MLLILLGDKCLTEIFKSLSELFQALIVFMIELFPLVLVLWEGIWRLPREDQEVSLFCWSDENKNQSLKREGKRLLMDLLTNKVFSKLILSDNFRTKRFLNWGIEWELRDSKLIILKAFFVKQQVD